jgi:hypothetical protein
MTRKQKITLTVVLDLAAILLIGGYVFANSFGVFNRSAGASTPVPLPTPPVAVVTPLAPSFEPAKTPAPDAPSLPPTDTPEPTPAWDGILDPKYYSLFLEKGETPVWTEDSYQSSDIYLKLTSHEEKRLKYWIVDVYVKHIENLQADYVNSDKKVLTVPKINKQIGAMLTINTDYWINANINKHGWFVRNGQELARHSENRMRTDLGVIYFDGKMETFTKEEFTSGALTFDTIAAKYPYHVFYFGPALLDKDGHAKTQFNATEAIFGDNPRTAIGYYEPGHYSIIIILGSRAVNDANGKQIYAQGKTGSDGMSMATLSTLCESLGMKAAYNLDGGQSTAMMFGDLLYGHNTRSDSDFLSIIEING